MIRQSMSIMKSLLLVSTLAFAVAGCTSESGDEGEDTTPDGVVNERVTAEDVQALPAGQKLELSLKDDTVFYFDYRKPIDFARVEMTAGDHKFTMEQHIGDLQNVDYGTSVPVDLTDSPDNQFRISSNPANFGQLTADEVEVLKREGYFYKELSSDQAKAQTTGENCTYGTCEVCGPPPGAESCNWSPSSPCVCTYELHEWCD